MNAELADIEVGLKQLDLQADGHQVEQLGQFLALLKKWNDKFNLVSRRDMGRLVSRHLLDSLTAAPLVRGSRVLDVGSGAGFPGIPLAVMQPRRQFILCDRLSRRARFLSTVARELGLVNVEVREADAAQLARADGFDCAVSRAVATPQALWDMVAPLLNESGCLLVYFSAGVNREDDETQPPSLPSVTGARISPFRYAVPGLDGQHTVLRLERT